jgi:hypothetical protein
MREAVRPCLHTHIHITQNVFLKSPLEINSLTGRPVCVCSEKVSCAWKTSIAVSSFVAATKMVIGLPQCNLITLGFSNDWMSKVPNRPTDTDKPAFSYTRRLLISQLMEVDFQTQPSAEPAWNKGLDCAQEYLLLSLKAGDTLSSHHVSSCDITSGFGIF